MKKTIITCDIKDRKHNDSVKEIEVDVIFDHDQDDGKSKTEPYFERKKIDICKDCLDFMMNNRIYIYAYGVMGHNNYWLSLPNKEVGG